ncbi:MAG: hypothetical protein ACLTDR_11785 [Adlercreutzia equolifaciens]
MEHGESVVTHVAQEDRVRDQPRNHLRDQDSDGGTRMPIKTGFDFFGCDRADKAHKSGKAPGVFLQKGESAREEWLSTAWTDAQGWSAPSCHAPSAPDEFRELDRDAARNFAQFANEGR